MDNQCLSICMGNDIWDIMDLILYWRMALDYYCWVIFNWTTIYYVYSILDFYSLMNIYIYGLFIYLILLENAYNICIHTILCYCIICLLFIYNGYCLLIIVYIYICMGLCTIW
jgi:hypothetical protein